jgi:hypothetical protein
LAAALQGVLIMPTQKQRSTARKNIKKAQSGAKAKRTISKLPKSQRSALGKKGAAASARARGKK